MGLIKTPEEAATRQHTPKIAFVAPPTSYVASSGKTIEATDVDLLVRALSMGKLRHAMMGTCAVAIGTAAAIPAPWSTRPPVAVRARPCALATPRAPCGWARKPEQVDGQWTVTKAIMSRSARVLMEGWVRVPGDTF